MAVPGMSGMSEKLTPGAQAPKDASRFGPFPLVQGGCFLEECWVCLCLGGREGD